MCFGKYISYLYHMKPKFTGTEKPCLKCCRTLPIEEFYMAKKTGVYSSRCKKCDLIHYRERFDSSYKKRAILLVNYAKQGSRKRGIQFSITKDDVIHQFEQQCGKCYYSGRLLTFAAGDENVMSIDRIDSSLGYTPNNIVICCWRINKMKNTCSSNEFLELCRDICHFSDKR